MNTLRRFLKTRMAALGGVAALSLAAAQAIRCPLPPSAASSGYAMKLECAGGYPGVEEQWLVRADGRVVNAIGQTARVSPEDVGEWRKRLAGLKLSGKAPGSSAPGIPLSMCMDCITCRITVYEKDRAESFVLTDLSAGRSTADGMNLQTLPGRLRRLDWK